MSTIKAGRRYQFTHEMVTQYMKEVSKYLGDNGVNRVRSQFTHFSLYLVDGYAIFVKWSGVTKPTGHGLATFDDGFFRQQAVGMVMSGWSKDRLAKEFHASMNKHLTLIKDKQGGSQLLTKEDKLKKELRELELRYEAGEFKGLKARSQARVQIKRIQYAIEGKDYDEEVAKQKAEQANRVKAAEDWEEQSKARAQSLAGVKTLTLPKNLLNEYNTKPYNRVKLTTYRGEMIEKVGTGSNTGTAMYGQGLYTTTSKAYAKQFGEVREVKYEELPFRPLRFVSQTAFSQFENELAKDLGIKKTHLYLVGDTSELVKALGYDGLTIGDGKDMILVTYY